MNSENDAKRGKVDLSLQMEISIQASLRLKCENRQTAALH